MQLWEVDGVMRKKHETKNVYYHIEMILVNGILKTNATNCGNYSMGKKIWENIFVYFLSQTGQNWMCGSIWPKKKSPYHIFNLRIKEKYLNGMEYSWPTVRISKSDRKKKIKYMKIGRAHV